MFYGKSWRRNKNTENFCFRWTRRKKITVSFLLCYFFTWLVYRSVCRSCHLDGQLSFSLCIKIKNWDWAFCLRFAGHITHNGLRISAPATKWQPETTAAEKKRKRKPIYKVIQNSEQLQIVEHECVLPPSFRLTLFNFILQLNVLWRTYIFMETAAAAAQLKT